MRACELCKGPTADNLRWCDDCAKLMREAGEGPANGWQTAARVRKAQNIVPILRAAGASANDAARMPEASWQLAANAASVALPSPTTRVIAVALLAAAV